MFDVLLYYAFAPVEDPEATRDAHRARCEALGLRGRIYVAPEGINGTVAGPPDACRAYEEFVHADPRFVGIPFKVTSAESIPFAKLRVKARESLINFGDHDGVDPNTEAGVALDADDWAAFFERDDDFVVLDVRNPYEWEVGRFEGAKKAPIDAFYDFGDWADSLDADPETPILTYCTGGIRCEKFTVSLKRRGFRNVYMLKDGILGYADKRGGDHFEGQVFVFDDRMVVDIGADEPTVSVCRICGAHTPRIRNCANMDCHKLFVCCDDCAIEHQGTCSDPCKDAPRLREVYRRASPPPVSDERRRVGLNRRAGGGRELPGRVRVC